jgi:hypothetical protein
MQRARSPASFVHTLEPRPNGESVARDIASSMSLKRWRSATGPKISSRAAGASGGMSARAVAS